ncbi:hypothetical protein TNCV_3244551 [Trichonephila clavipes]|nr:hypothetical protein TNCV_3244551 [Trichonephila clavipes]
MRYVAQQSLSFHSIQSRLQYREITARRPVLRFPLSQNRVAGCVCKTLKGGHGQPNDATLSKQKNYTFVRNTTMVR